MFRETFATLALVAAVVAAPAMAQDATDYLGVPGPITIGDTSYSLAWSSNPQPGYFKQEYLPQGASPESFTSMVIVEFLATDQPIANVVAAQVDMVNQRKATDPVANLALLENKQAGEIVLDFLLSAKDEAGEFIIEWNGYRYAAAEHNGQAGSLLFAVSERAYGNTDAEAFLKGLGEFKTQRILDLTKAELPQLR